MERIETTILRNLICNENYSRKVIPFIEPTYFEQRGEKVIFEEITQFIVKYGSAITTEALNIEVENPGLNIGVVKFGDGNILQPSYHQEIGHRIFFSICFACLQF